MSSESQELKESRSLNDQLPQRRRYSSGQMLVLRPASQPFQGTETTDAGMPQGTDTRTPGWDKE